MLSVAHNLDFLTYMYVLRSEMYILIFTLATQTATQWTTSIACLGRRKPSRYYRWALTSSYLCKRCFWAPEFIQASIFPTRRNYATQVVATIVRKGSHITQMFVLTVRNMHIQPMRSLTRKDKTIILKGQATQIDLHCNIRMYDNIIYEGKTERYV